MGDLFCQCFWRTLQVLIGAERGGGAVGHVIEKVADIALLVRVDAFEKRALGAGAARDEHLFVNCGGTGDNMRLFLESGEEILPVPDAVVLQAQKVDVRHGAQQAGLAVNAGHDLNQRNLGTLKRAIPQLAEVSIGHALIGEALYEGLAETVRNYLAILEA